MFLEDHGLSVGDADTAPPLPHCYRIIRGQEQSTERCGGRNDACVSRTPILAITFMMLPTLDWLFFPLTLHLPTSFP